MKSPFISKTLLSLLLTLVPALPATALAQNTPRVADAGKNYTVSGDVTFRYDGDIYIYLFTKEGFRDFTSKFELLPSPRCKIIKMNTNIEKAGRVSFRFDGVPKGTYCIVTFEDVNKNRKVDFLGKIHDEPYGSYKEQPSWYNYLQWGLIKFDLEKDITGIKIRM
jgi:uncharacterized protein (DUF2141 family)